MIDYITPILVFAGVVISAMVTWLVAKRTTSGNISTSDAASLWAESNTLRKEYRLRAESLESQLQEVNTKLQQVMTELTALKTNSASMSKKIDELKRVIATLQKENKRLLELKSKGNP